MTLPIGTKIPLFAEGNATENDVLEGKTFSTEKGNGLKGKIPKMGEKEIIPKETTQELGLGFYNKIKIKGFNELDQNSCENIINSIKDKFPTMLGKKYARGNKRLDDPYTLTISNLNFKPSIVLIKSDGETYFYCITSPIIQIETPFNLISNSRVITTNGKLQIQDNGFICTQLYNQKNHNIPCEWLAIE